MNEQPKQETLEEVAKNYSSKITDAWGIDEACNEAFKDGAKWQQQQDKKLYSEEILDILDNVRYWETCPDKYKVIIEEWFEQFKKK